MGSKTCIAVLGIFVTIIMALSGYFVGANADQNDAIKEKADSKTVTEFKEKQEKEHDKIDQKFDKVIAQMATTNTRLERIATQLEERTN